jgi:type I restriction-modification system DNA methylase subunit
METGQLSWIANYIWGIADDILRDLYVRGKYRDVILPMTVLRRLDSLLEPTKKVVLSMKATLDKAKIANQDQALRQASGQSFYKGGIYFAPPMDAFTKEPAFLRTLSYAKWVDQDMGFDKRSNIR